MKLLSFTIGLFILTSCLSGRSMSEHEVSCHISGDGFEAKSVRVCLIWEDIRNSNDYQEIKVRDCRFDSEVILDTNQVYEIIIPHPEYGYSTYRTAAFFYSRDGVRFGVKPEIDGERVVLVNPTGENLKYYGYKNHRDSLFMNRYIELMASQDSLNTIGQMYDSRWVDMCDMLNNDELSQDVRDSLTIETNKMSMSGENRTFAGQMWQKQWHAYRSDKQDYDYNYLVESDSDQMGLFVIMDNIHISQQRNSDISKWLNLYENKYMELYPDNRMHELINTAGTAASMVEGRHYIDFTLPDEYGNEKSLTELIGGKVAVVELWASWCRSCRVKARSLKPLYEKYHNSGFEVVGIAREYRNLDKWIKALKDDAYPWPDLVALEDNHHIWTQYGCPDVAGRTLLLDKNGIIVKIDPTLEEIDSYLQCVIE